MHARDVRAFCNPFLRFAVQLVVYSEMYCGVGTRPFSALFFGLPQDDHFHSSTSPPMRALHQHLLILKINVFEYCALPGVINLASYLFKPVDQ